MRLRDVRLLREPLRFQGDFAVRSIADEKMVTIQYSISCGGHALTAWPLALDDLLATLILRSSDSSFPYRRLTSILTMLYDASSITLRK